MRTRTPGRRTCSTSPPPAGPALRSGPRRSDRHLTVPHRQLRPTRESVSISADGSTIAVGVFGRASSAIDGNVGAVDVYQRSGMNWANQTAPPHADPRFGAGRRPARALGRIVWQREHDRGRGDRVRDTTTPFIGEAWVWQQPQRAGPITHNPNAVLLSPNAITAANNFFGGSTAISADAKTIVIGATGVAGGRGAAFVYTSPNGVWTSAPNAAATLMSSDGTGAGGHGRSRPTVTWSSSGTPFVTIGGNMAQGAAYVYVEPPTGWRDATETQKLFSSDGQARPMASASRSASRTGRCSLRPPAATCPDTPTPAAIYVFGPFPTTSISLSPAAPERLQRLVPQRGPGHVSAPATSARP